MSPVPYMPVYVGEVLATSANWEGEARALFLLLLLHAWAGALPADLPRLALVLGYDLERLQDLWPTVCGEFRIVDAKLRNDRLEEHREHALRLQAQRASASALGVKSRQQRRQPNGQSSGQPNGGTGGTTISGSGSGLDSGKNTKTAREGVPRETESEIHVRVAGIKDRYPKAPARADWISGERNARNAVLRGDATWDELYAGTVRYADHCRATGRMVMNPARFFGDVDRPWTHEWAIPLRPGQAPPPNNDAAWAEAKAHAAAIGFRPHGEHESVSAYTQAMKTAESTRRATPSGEAGARVAALANKLRSMSS